MGNYVCSRDEIYEAIKEALDNLEGDVFRKDFDNACKDVYNKYKYFTDKKQKALRGNEGKI